VAQDFWASSGFALLGRSGSQLVATDAWLVRFLSWDQLAPPQDAGPAERALHLKLDRSPRAAVAPREIEAIEDDDARENWRAFLAFRDRVAAFPTLEAAYRDLFAKPSVDLAPVFVDALAQAIVRGILDGTDDAWLCRAGEMLFRLQRVSTEGGRALAADAATLELFAETGGFGDVGRLLRRERAALPEVKMDVLNAENAPFYFLRDELYGFALDLTPGGEGVRALAEVLRRWVVHMAGARVTVEPVRDVHDERWRWHVGLDVDASAILDALYRGEALAEAQLERVIALFRLDFDDAADALAEVAGKPVYLGLACRPDRTLRIKPQNLLANLPLASRSRRGG
jgi:hypothetical protein